MKYEIIYDQDICFEWTNEEGYTEYWCDTIRNAVEIFSGTWDELQDRIREMRESDCYHISANAIPENEDNEDEVY